LEIQIQQCGNPNNKNFKTFCSAMYTEEVTNSNFVVPIWKKDKKAIEIHLYTEHDEVLVVIPTTLRYYIHICDFESV
jgi:hypothetical protein